MWFLIYDVQLDWIVWLFMLSDWDPFDLLLVVTLLEVLNEPVDPMIWLIY